MSLFFPVLQDENARWAGFFGLGLVVVSRGTRARVWTSRTKPVGAGKAHGGPKRPTEGPPRPLGGPSLSGVVAPSTSVLVECSPSSSSTYPETVSGLD